MKKLIFLTIIIFSAIGFGCNSKLTAETTGLYKSAVIDRYRKTSTRKTSSNKTKKKTTTSIETEIEYSYTVNGTNYNGYSENDGDVQRNFQSGAPVTVCYNPSSPEESDVVAAGTKCGS